MKGEEIALSLQAPPVDGKANASLVRFLAGALGVKARDVTVVAGLSSRSKIVLVEGMGEGEASRRLLGPPEGGGAGQEGGFAPGPGDSGGPGMEMGRGRPESPGTGKVSGCGGKGGASGRAGTTSRGKGKSGRRGR
jgi:hypothetical protein